MQAFTAYLPHYLIAKNLYHSCTAPNASIAIPPLLVIVPRSTLLCEAVPKSCQGGKQLEKNVQMRILSPRALPVYLYSGLRNV